MEHRIQHDREAGKYHPVAYQELQDLQGMKESISKTEKDLYATKEQMNNAKRDI